MSVTRPNFFIVGAAKAGTTSLWHSFRSHPEVFVPQDIRHKEPAYFSPLSVRPDEQAYLRLYSQANSKQRMIGDASAHYLTDPDSPQLIHNFCRAAKIVIVLRDPAARAYSLYNWMAAAGFEYARDFKHALRLEEQRSKKAIPNKWEPEYFWNYMYYRSGLYADQVRRYLELFPRDHVLLLRFGDLVKDYQSTFDKVCRFLEVSPQQVPATPRNESRAVWHPSLQFALHKVASRVPNRLWSFTASLQGRQRFLNLGIRKRKPASADEETLRSLSVRYRPNVVQLQEITGMSFDSWTR